VNGDLRQDSSTANLIVGVPELIRRASEVTTLYPGDIYATGTPEGVGPIVPGDEVRIAIEQVGEMRLPVRLRSW
jgi:2-keto-4-pentenoate hydratase/2-oxohepta-3-ene-1,7-dioic acid hydratase in catechol pathway